MKNIDWKRKLTSRKLWLAVAGFAAGLIVALDGSAEAAETVSGCIMSGASVIAYIVGEGLTDAANAGSTLTLEGLEIQDPGKEDTQA
jgi:hypothetical protein